MNCLVENLLSVINPVGHDSKPHEPELSCTGRASVRLPDNTSIKDIEQF